MLVVGEGAENCHCFELGVDSKERLEIVCLETVPGVVSIAVLQVRVEGVAALSLQEVWQPCSLVIPESSCIFLKGLRGGGFGVVLLTFAFGRP